MTRNLGSFDRVFRTLVAIAAGVLILANVVTGITAIVLGVLAVVFVLTSAVSYCPLYAAFKISTHKK
jgi:hypothetical protein